jgi:hypothetical protein
MHVHLRTVTARGLENELQALVAAPMQVGGREIESEVVAGLTRPPLARLLEERHVIERRDFSRLQG